MARFFDDIRLPRDPDVDQSIEDRWPDLATTKRYVDREVDKKSDTTHTHPLPSSIRTRIQFINADSLSDPTLPDSKLWLGMTINSVADLVNVTEVTISARVPLPSDPATIVDIADETKTYMKMGDTVSMLYTDNWGGGTPSNTLFVEWTIKKEVIVDKANNKIIIPVQDPPVMVPPLIMGNVVPDDGDTVEFRWVPQTLQAHTHEHDTLLGLEDGKHNIDDVAGLEEDLAEKSDIGHVHPSLPESDLLDKTVYKDIHTNYIGPIPGSSGVIFVGASESESRTTDDRTLYIIPPDDTEQGDFLIAFLIVKGCDVPIVFSSDQIRYDESTGLNPVTSVPFEQIITDVEDVELGLVGVDNMQQQILWNIADRFNEGFLPPYASLVLTLPANVPPGLPLRLVMLAYRGIDRTQPFHSIHNARETSSIDIPGGPIDTNNLVTIACISTFVSDTETLRPRYYYSIPWTPTRKTEITKTGSDINYFYGEFYYPSDAAIPYPTVYLLQYPTYPVVSGNRFSANGIVILRSLVGGDTDDIITIGGDVLIDGDLIMDGTIDMNGHPIIGLPDPQPDDPTSAVSKKYVDSTIWKAKTVRARSDIPIDVGAALLPTSIDGVTLKTGDLVLLTEQIDKTQNGVWVVDSYWYRSKDFQLDWQLRIGSTIYVEDGENFHGQTYTLKEIDGVRENKSWVGPPFPEFTWEEGGGMIEILWGDTVPKNPTLPANSWHTVTWVDSSLTI